MKYRQETCRKKNTTANLEEPNTGDNQRAGMIVTFDPTCIGCRGGSVAAGAGRASTTCCIIDYIFIIRLNSETKRYCIIHYANFKTKNDTVKL